MDRLGTVKFVSSLLGSTRLPVWRRSDFAGILASLMVEQVGQGLAFRSFIQTSPSSIMAQKTFPFVFTLYPFSFLFLGVIRHLRGYRGIVFLAR